MANKTLMFALGGMPAWPLTAGYVVRACRSVYTRFVFLLEGGIKTIHTLPDYSNPLKEWGITDYEAVFPEKGRVFDPKAAQQQIENSRAIVVGGGHTPFYHKLFATEPMRSAIRTQFLGGVPYAGISAGALIAPAKSAFWESEGGSGQERIFEGLGLVDGFQIDVHFTQRQRLAGLVEALALSGQTRGYGIDDAACAVFRDGAFAGMIGSGVYQVELLNPRTRQHRVVETTLRYKG